MREHYDVGVVGCWYWGNYGSLLNGYATFSILKSFGLSPLNIVTPYNGFEPHAKRFFEKVYDENDLSEVLPFERLGEYNGKCNSFLTGSDQIWHYNPNKGERRFANYFKLDFVDDAKKKISFSTSFGRYVQEPDSVLAENKKLLSRYSAISVREDESVDILAKQYGILGTRVMEPVFDVTKDVWDKLAEYSQYNEKEKYLLTYILDPTEEKRKAIQFYSEKLGIKAVNILDGFSGRYERVKQILNLPNTLPNITAFDLLRYYQNASFVITDSFHGACFSIIYNKPFIAVQNIMRGVERFKTLLSSINMSDRLVSDTKIPLDEKFLEKIDFTNANRVIERERDRSVKWLKNALLTPIEKLPSVEIKNVNTKLDKKLCMGCGACVSACPVDAVHFGTDKYGSYKAEVDFDKCVNCGKCVDVCAAIELPRNLNTPAPIAYAFITSDKNELMSCASGGAATVLAKSVIDKGGCVVGAAWTDDFVAEHIFAYTKEDLNKQKKSKYFQSYMGDTFKKIKEKLGDGKPLMFVGTPCQAAGLRKYLGKGYSNLLIVDLFCANCPSAGLFKKYLGERFDLNELAAYNFRHKNENDTIMGENTSLITYKDGRTQTVTAENNDDYLKVFHSCSLSLSSHCLDCKYQGTMRVGDLTIGDCWGIQKYDKSVDPSKGVSLILVNNAKGEEFLSSVPKEYIGVLKEEPLESVKKYNVVAFTSERHWPDTLRRRVFLDTVEKTSYHAAKEAAMKIAKGKMSYFHFDPTYWRDDYLDGSTVLTTQMPYPEIGHYCMLALPDKLEKGKRYKLKIKFKLSTSSPDFNFHIKRSNSREFQVIHTHKVTPQNNNTWIIIEKEFTPNNSFYDEFMIGAAQLRGENRSIMIDYIRVEEI